MEFQSKYFTAEDVPCKCERCKGKGIPVELEPAVLRTLGQLEKAREILQRGINVNSWIRCAEHNREVGGVRDSQHLTGGAVDIWVKGIHGLWLMGFLEGLISQGVIADGGLGTYRDRPRIVHYDTRLGKPSRWGALLV